MIQDCANRHTVAMVRDGAMLKLGLPSRTAEISTPLIKRMPALLVKDGETPAHVVIHSVGMSILNHVREILGINRGKLKHSYKTWENCGNMSSATIGFALESLLSSGQLQHNDDRGLCSGLSLRQFQAILMVWPTPMQPTSFTGWATVSSRNLISRSLSAPCQAP